MNKSNAPKISVCIPAYNRSKYLRQVLDSVLTQADHLHEIVICEDLSPERELIRGIVEGYARDHGTKIVYHENAVNLGFDGNIRQLVKTATGDYCLFLGNDDVLAPGGLDAVADLLRRNPDTGVVIRGYGWFEGSPANVVGEVKYFKAEHVFPPGLDAVQFAFRRACVLAGLVLRRDAALPLESKEFDGSLFYQIHLAGHLAYQHGCVFTPTMVALCRADEKPEFGNAESEKQDFTPGEYTIAARLKMMGGIVAIGNSLQRLHPKAPRRILRDISTYSFPWLAYHADKPFRVFWRYYVQLGRMGLSTYPIYHLYFFLILVLGADRIHALIKWLRRALGATPQFRFR
jgi:abequosyltransferase